MKMKLQILSLLLFIFSVRTESATQPPFACDSANTATKTLPFCRPSLPIGVRARDLVARLTLDEKISQLVNSAPEIPRLGVPAYEWWSEALHGVADAGFGVRFTGAVSAATSFPQVILTAATFDDHLWYRIGQVIGTEARAVYNAGEAQGMTFWTPNINIYRDPRWGRGQETPGEDPVLTGKYAVAYVRGLQGDSYDGRSTLGGGRLLASACCKHFTAYDLDSWKGINRFVFDAKVTQQDLADTYQPPFQSCIEKGRASGIMCAYNRVNGVPNCADFNLLSKTARALWKFNGYITSDCDAVSIIYDAQGFAKTPEDAVADVLKAGMDVNCGSYLKNHTKKAVLERKLPISQIDRAIRNLFSVRMRLGLFDGNPAQHPLGKIGPDQVCSPAHQALALEAARNGIVLLKNSAKLLPLAKSKPTLAVIGPNANSPKTLQGNYYGPPCRAVTPLLGLKRYAGKVFYHQGCNAVNCAHADVTQAVEVAKRADYVVMVMGLDQTEEREDYDRVQLGLPGNQQQLISAVAAASKRPIVLVILSGGPVDVSFAKYDSHVGSILWAGYPGEAGGAALAEIIFGDHNPGGRLPVTWYPKDFVKVPMTDMRMRASSGYPGRTYRFYTGPKVFEFGYGLSYTTYKYTLSSDIGNIFRLGLASSPDSSTSTDPIRYHLVSALSEQFCESKSFSVAVRVENLGEMAGKDSVLLFARRREPKNDSPLKQLVGFGSVNVELGKTAHTEFALNPCEHLSSADKNGSMVLEEATHVLFVGDHEYSIDVVF